MPIGRRFGFLIDLPLVRNLNVPVGGRFSFYAGYRLIGGLSWLLVLFRSRCSVPLPGTA
jgi:hypothetical protein